MGILQGVLRYATVRGEVSANPVREVNKPRQRRTQAPQPVTPLQVETMRDQLATFDATLVSLLAYGGLRPRKPSTSAGNTSARGASPSHDGSPQPTAKSFSWSRRRKNSGSGASHLVGLTRAWSSRVLMAENGSITTGATGGGGRTNPRPGPLGCRAICALTACVGPAGPCCSGRDGR